MLQRVAANHMMSRICWSTHQYYIIIIYIINITADASLTHVFQYYKNPSH